MGAVAFSMVSINNQQLVINGNVKTWERKRGGNVQDEGRVLYKWFQKVTEAQQPFKSVFYFLTIFKRKETLNRENYT